MTCDTATEINVGGPVEVNIPDARRGSPWRITMTFSDDLDLSGLASASLTLKPAAGGASTVIVGDITQKAVGVVSFFAAKAATLAVAAGVYYWETEFTTATGQPLDGWAPMAGTWRVTERVTA